MAGALVPGGGGGASQGQGAASSHNELGIFTEPHGFLRSTVREIEQLKTKIALDDEESKKELDQLRRELEKERLERRNALNSLRYEFEEFVHKKIDKVLEEVEDMKRKERNDDTA